jgi:hypothetical protein
MRGIEVTVDGVEQKISTLDLDAGGEVLDPVSSLIDADPNGVRRKPRP